MLVTLTRDLGKVVSALHGIQPNGTNQLLHALQVGQLALKHREDKNKRQRLIIFVGSPIVDKHDEYIKLGKRLRKNGIAVDIINFGEYTDNAPQLEALFQAANGSTSDGTTTSSSDASESHIITVPPGSHILSDVLL